MKTFIGKTTKFFILVLISFLIINCKKEERNLENNETIEINKLASLNIKPENITYRNPIVFISGHKENTEYYGSQFGNIASSNKCLNRAIDIEEVFRQISPQ